MRSVITMIALSLLPGFSSASPVADFELIDVNPTSPRFDASVSPRDYQHQVSAYYFGAAT